MSAADATKPLKIVVVGDSGVGKTSLMKTFVDEYFNEYEQSTIGCDIKLKTVLAGGRPVKLSIWDTAGQEKFADIAPLFYRDALGAVLVYDATRRATYLNIRGWLRALDTYSTKTGLAKVLVGNKIDLGGREVTSDEGRGIAEFFGMHFIECSAKTADGVGAAFVKVAEMVMTNLELMENYGTQEDGPELEPEAKLRPRGSRKIRHRKQGEQQNVIKLPVGGKMEPEAEIDHGPRRKGGCGSYC